MLFLGTTFLGSADTCHMTPTDLNNITYVGIKDGWYDDLYLSAETISEPTGIIPDYWDYDTLLYAKFNDEELTAGNTEFTLNTVSDLVVKRRIKDTFDWVVLYTKKINSIEDFNFFGIDDTNQGEVEYQYALAPYLNGVEGNYSMYPIESKLNRIFLVGQDHIEGTLITDGFCDTTRNIKGMYNELLNSRYPVFYSNSIANYDTGTVEGSFYKADEACEVEYENYHQYQKSIMDFITDGKPKLLKHMDGRIWLIQVTPSPTDTAKDFYKNRAISFSWVEIGSATSNEDLYNAGILDVEQEWWEV